MSFRAFTQHFHLLKRKDYAFYFSGQLVSMSGSFMQGVVQSWLVYRLSGSSFWLGFIAFCLQFPAFIACPLAGVITDQTDRRKLLSRVLALMMLQSSLLAYLTITHQIEIWHIAALAIFMGVLNAFEMTARHSAAIEFVGRDELPHAIAMNAFLINVSKVVGPLAAGLFIKVWGEGVCFALNAVSYLAVIWSLRAFRNIKPSTLGPLVFWKPLKEGLSYVKTHRRLHFPLLFAIFLGFVGAPYMVLLPSYVKDLLHGDATTLSWLTAAHAFGALFGTVMAIDPRNKSQILWKILVRRILLFSLFLSAFALSNHLAISIVMIALMGMSFMGCYPLINHALQAQVDDAYRSRVISIYMMTFLGSLPLGGLISGMVAETLSIQDLHLTTVGLCLIIVLWIRTRYQTQKWKSQVLPLEPERDPRQTPTWKGPPESI